MSKPYLVIIDTKLNIEEKVDFKKEIKSNLANIDKILMNFKDKDSLASNLAHVGYVVPQTFDFKIKHDSKVLNVLYGDNPVVNYFSEEFAEPNFKASKCLQINSLVLKFRDSIKNEDFRKYLIGQLDPASENNLLDAINMYIKSNDNQDYYGTSTAIKNMFKEFEKYSTIRTFSEIVFRYNENYNKNINILSLSVIKKHHEGKIDLFKTNFDVFYLADKRKTKPVLKFPNHTYIENPVRKSLDNPNQDKLNIWTLEEMQDFLPHDELEELNDNINFGRIR